VVAVHTGVPTHCRYLHTLRFLRIGRILPHRLPRSDLAVRALRARYRTAARAARALVLTICGSLPLQQRDSLAGASFIYPRTLRLGVQLPSALIPAYPVPRLVGAVAWVAVLSHAVLQVSFVARFRCLINDQEQPSIGN